MDVLIARAEKLGDPRRRAALKAQMPRESLITNYFDEIIITDQEDEEDLFRAIKLGAAAYFLKDVDPTVLIEAVRRVSQGEYLINDDVLSKPQLASRVLKSFRELTVEEEDSETKDSYSPLSGREVLNDSLIASS